MIVESPTKAKTISNYLNKHFKVEASMGHVYDLPKPSSLPKKLKKSTFGKFSIDIDNNFQPYYMVSKNKKKYISRIKKALNKADALYLATDGDREGEAIAWHLVQILKPIVPVYRLRFSEITKSSIKESIKNIKNINKFLVSAQETRRIVDRLYGYVISPLLWKKIAQGLSAGRVQSVTIRLLVNKEIQRINFISQKYNIFSIYIDKIINNKLVEAQLQYINDDKIYSKKDLNNFKTINSLKNNDILNQLNINELKENLINKKCIIEFCKNTKYSRKPSPPYITSTLQQDSATKLLFSAEKTMKIAQKLYENGYITYMRTDSLSFSKEGIAAARKQIIKFYGKRYITKVPRTYKNKVKNTQEAHEAIRPAGITFKNPKDLRDALNEDELKLYSIIWKRTLASQMVNAEGIKISIILSSNIMKNKYNLRFKFSDSFIQFPGFLKIMKSNIDLENATKKDEFFKKFHEGNTFIIKKTKFITKSTQPPNRYTEASLIKTLEKLGIGRPSTYAKIISTIINRGYVQRKNQTLIPRWIAFSVINLMEKYLKNYVDYDFTADMEEGLDKIARGEIKNSSWLNNFYYGSSKYIGLKKSVDKLKKINAKKINSIKISKEITLRIGRFGPYIEKKDINLKYKRVSIPCDLKPDELNKKTAEKIFQTQSEKRVLGLDPKTGNKIVVKSGIYGPYVTEIFANEPEKKCKARTASLFKNMNVTTISLKEAIKILNLPRFLGKINNESITVHNGRYGPYLKKGFDFRSLNSEDEIFTITLQEATCIYNKAKKKLRKNKRI